MKLAYCYFGLLRTSNNCLSTHAKNLPEIDKSDVFVHTWYQFTVAKYWHGSAIESFEKAVLKLRKFSKFNTKKIVIDQQQPISGDDLVCINGENVYWKSGVYLWKTILGSALLLKEYAKDGDKYDRIIFLRPDLKIKSRLPIIDFLEAKNELLFCGTLDSYDDNNNGIYRCEDLIFSINFDNLDEFIEFCTQRVSMQYKMRSGVLLNGQNPLLDFARKINSSTKHLNFIYPKDFEIKRDLVSFKYLKKIVTRLLRLL